MEHVDTVAYIVLGSYGVSAIQCNGVNLYDKYGAALVGLIETRVLVTDDWQQQTCQSG